MTTIIRLTTHSTDPKLVVLHTPPDNAADMARLEGAMYDPSDRTYLLHVDALPALAPFARYIGAHVIDQRATTTGGHTVAQECRHCAQPGSLSHPPAYCPDCGRPWEPVGPPIGIDSAARHACLDCGHRQSGRFNHCSNCGAHMPALDTPAQVEQPRRRLPDPLPLSDTVDAVLDTIVDR